MHDSATEYVIMLEIEPAGLPSALVFSTVGCLGQIGMNEAGIAVGINNLSAAVGRAGVTWPFVVRKALQQTDIDAALACVMEADLAGAHNYLLLDRRGRGYNVEAMPGCRKVSELAEGPLFHTNHCLDSDAKREEAEKPPALLASSHARLRRARELIGEEPVTFKHLVDLTRDSEAICQ